MPLISVIDTGLIYRDPSPQPNPRQAYFPSVVQLESGSLLASCMIGGAMEAIDCQVHLCRSDDGAKTWTMPRPLRVKSPTQTETCRITHLGGNRVALLLSVSQRLDAVAAATNPDNLGHVPNSMSLYRSDNGGEQWAKPEPIDPPLVGPAFELCSPIVRLADGRWLLPTSTWRGWDGFAPNGMKAVAFVSEDCGHAWPRYVDVMDGTASGTLFWEQKIIEIDGGRLLSVAWAYDEARRADQRNHYAIADRGTLCFGPPTATPLQGQTPDVMHLGEGRVLCVYRRTDRPGLWACVAQIDRDGSWQTLAEHGLTQPAQSGPSTDGSSLSEGFRALRVGAPCLTRLDASTVLLSFWAVEDNVANLRWMRLAV